MDKKNNGRSNPQFTPRPRAAFSFSGGARGDSEPSFGGQGGFFFQKGAIKPSLVTRCIASAGSKNESGGYSIFLGKVRVDRIKSSSVTSIEYTAYEEMAIDRIHEIRCNLMNRFALSELIIRHSLGMVKAGEICFLVMAAARHRKEAFEACRVAVDEVKESVPVWGKEIMSNKTNKWKAPNK